MRGRSITATLALAFGATTLAVFVLVGNFLYRALEREVSSQDDMSIVLAARHARRLAAEIDTTAGIREHGDRITSIVLGNPGMSIEVFDPDGQLAIEHNVVSTLGTAMPVGDNSILSAGRSIARVPETARITEASIAGWTNRTGSPIRGIATDAKLRDGEMVSILIARNMSDRYALLDHYRDTLKICGTIGVILTTMLSYLLIRAAMRPVREIAASASEVTVNRLNTRIAVASVPRELETLVTTLNAMLERMDHGFKQMSRFTADLAHDMRTPLSNMRGATEVALARPRSTDEYEALLASNLEECERLSRMIENVLFLARAEHPQFVKHMRVFDAVQELTHIGEYFEGVAEDADVRIRVTGSAMLTADLELFRRALSNLLANALRYTPRGKEIVLDAHRTDDRVRVTVSNEGEPIAPEHLERIFDRFYRIDPSRSSLTSSHASQGSPGSTGLGLAIVRTIMELHGGTVHAESDASGTRFVLVFL
ncbi:heavy metal sensor histidine kinase [Paraburkholderia diazotrophica]|uniref:Sensor protein n=1 Tax=Paraburkholderia diazotrophica TaxID=667676 RepID=A0A1H6SVV3_9BURK|nr:heavy metal sensor histidine kinase [Paraburkholderia diazotrophica]SEI68170.1 two-component system, OmpR family, heavy metal sensor histidine kinase CusS [Paraburkholderia diazotrophica]